jgi:ankyrin repeat protein
MRIKAAIVLVLFASAVSAQTIPVEDRFYQAIRQNDLSALQSLVREHGIDTKGSQGQTPLMLAAAFGSADAVRVLIASGADVKMASPAGVTAVHWAVTDIGKTRTLIDAGADVHAVTQLGRTPLIIAAAAHDSSDVVRLLLSKGANVNAADNTGVTPLIAAANADNLEVATMLLAHGADVHSKARTGQPSTALMGAAVNGNAKLVTALLARKPDLTVVSADRTVTGKHGPVRFGGLTALHAAITGGNRDVVEMLLKAGVPVDARDVRGMTPLMWAIGTDRPASRIVSLLLAHQADATLISPDGESARDWARKFNNPAVLTHLKLLPAAASAPALPSLSPVRSSAMEAVARSLPIQRAASATVMTSGGCPACHAQPLTTMVLETARARWPSLSPDVESAQVPFLLNAFSPQMLQLAEGGGMPDALVYATMAMATQQMPSNRSTDALVRYLAAKQRAAGNWKGVGGTRAPMQDGDFSRTAMAIRALTVYGTPALAHDYQEHVSRAAGWLSRQTPLTTEDRVMQLLGLHWADAHAGVRRARVNELLTLQREDGGWSQTPYLASDAYATGQVLYVLRELGVPAADATMQRGVAFLLRTQRDDGSWFVKSRAMKIQPYFESGFPYGHDQWISHAGTAWATLGLASAALDEPATDPFVGTFTLNAAKSTMSGVPAVVEGTLIITEDGANLVMTPSFRTTDGPVRAGRLVVPKAGGIVRAPEGEVAYDSSIVTRVNPNTIQVVTTLQGKEGVRVQLTLSPDGKTLSRSIKGTNPQGQPLEGLSVLERQ